MPSLLRDRRTLIYLFLGLRLILPIVYPPAQVNGVERGLSASGDFQTYYNFASLSTQGKLPYRDFWYEFPPVFPIVSLAVYAVTSARGADYAGYAALLGLVMTAFDLLNLLVIIRLGRRLHGDDTGIALGWLYALLAAPLVLSWWTFEPMVTAAILLSILWLIEGKDGRSALAAAFGALIKLFPLILLAVAIRFRSLQQVARWIGVVLAVSGLGIGGMLLFGGSNGIPSLTAQFNKASYESIWALVDGNYRTGNFGSVADRFDPAKASELVGNPPRIPGAIRLAVFAAIGLFVFATTRRFDGRGVLAFASITVTLFFLWAQGWSPQWLTLIPLLLLNFPTRDGVLACLALGLISFFEYPILFSRTGDTGGLIAPAQLPLYSILIIGRTALLAGFAVALYRILRRPAVEASPEIMKARYWFAILFGLALLLRTMTIGIRALWYDEAFAVLFSQHGLSGMLYGTLTPVHGVAADVHPLLYYLLLELWTLVFKTGVVTVRIPSVLFSLGTLAVLYALARDLFDERTARVTLVIATLAPFFVQYSQEARMYSLLSFLLILATWCFVRGSRTLKPGWWIGLMVCAALAMYAQQLAAFYLVALGAAALGTRRRAVILRMALAGAGAVLIYLPWFLQLPGQLDKLGSYWVGRPTVAELLLTLRTFFFVDMDVPNALALILSLFAAVLITVFLLYRAAAVIARRRSGAGPLALLLWLVLVPIGLMWLVSQVRPVYINRALLPSALIFYLALGWLFTRARLPRPLVIGLAAVGLASALAGLLSFYTWNTFPRGAFRQVIADIKADFREGDVVVHANKITALPFAYYDAEKALPVRYVADPPGSGSDTLALPTQTVLGLLADPCVANAVRASERVWYVIFDRQGAADLAWLGIHFHLDDLRRYNDLKVYLFSQPDSEAKLGTCPPAQPSGENP